MISLSNKENACGYIISNFPETIDQAQKIFNLETQLVSEDENDVHLLQNEINPSTIIYHNYSILDKCK